MTSKKRRRHTPDQIIRKLAEGNKLLASLESNDQNLWVRRDVAHVSELVDWRSAMPVT